MRKSLIGTALVVAALAVMSAAPAAAFHGAAYTARGTATLRATGTPLDAVVKWSGAFGIGGGTYTVDLYVPGTTVPVHKNTFQGRETLTNVHFIDGCVEYVDYLGEGTVGLVGGPINLIVVQIGGGPTVGGDQGFRIAGWQLNNLCTGIANMHYEGHYLNLFDMDLDVWGPPGA